HKADRNRRLLLQEIRRRPDDPYIAYQLGKEHESAHEFREAADLYLKALQLAAPGMAWRKGAAARLLHCLSQAGALEQAVVLSSELMNECQAFPDYFFVLGNMFLDMAAAQPALALEQWLPMAEAAWLRCLE
ncbi:hypothetical protein, partial [Acinetobacter sp. NIOH-H-8]|uniref:hypothetical protein n=1 Tax=Acinetobacter sp. NIOH-H-8 TaxID=3342120 RepID=UPI0039884726